MDDQQLKLLCDTVLQQLDECIANKDVHYNENVTIEYIENEADCALQTSQDNKQQSNPDEDTSPLMMQRDKLLDVSNSVDEPELDTIQKNLNLELEKDDSEQEKQETDENTKTDDMDSHVPADAKENNNLEKEERSKKRKRKSDESEWPRNRIKKLRMYGKAYEGYKRTKDGVITQGVPRPERKMGKTCTSVACLKSTKRFCQSFSEEERRSIFNKFWNNMESWDDKKVYVTGNVEYVSKKRQSTEGPSRRRGTYYYYLRTRENERKKVCKTMFLATLGLKEDMVHDWVANTEHGLNINNTQEAKSSRTRSDSALKIKKRNYLKEWLEILPKLSSHYCRKDSQKLYLEQIFYSKIDLYRVYENYCKSNDKQNFFISFPIFDEIFTQMNLSLYKPKKDRCDVCCAFETNNVDEVKYKTHRERKDRARKEKEEDKVKSLEGKNYTLVIDVQAVKICPVINASAIYYKMKLNCHNFTVYNLATHQSTC